jgi:hypothetical protein
MGMLVNLFEKDEFQDLDEDSEEEMDQQINI